MTEVELPDESLDDEPAGTESTEGSETGRRGRWRRAPRLRRIALKLGVALLSVVATLTAVEVVFRLLGYQPVYDVYSNPDEFFRADPVLGWSFAPGARGEYVGPRPFPIEFRNNVRINSLGLRGPEIPPVPPGGLRVLVLGDSWVAALEVPEDRTYSVVLQRELTDRLGVPVQVINAGVRGYGTDQAWLLYRERLRRLHPDLVLYHTTGNDPEDNTVVHRMHRTFSKPAFVLGADGRLRPVERTVHQYPQCSEYRVVDGAIHRADGRRAQALCWVQTRLSDHSAFFSFVTQRLQGNPALVRRLYGLSFPDDSRPPGPDNPAPAGAPGTPPPTTAGASTPPTTGGAGPPGTTTAPATSGPGQGSPATTAGAAPPDAAAGRPGAGGAPAPGLDQPHVLTSALIRQLAADVRADGADFVLVGTNGDLGALDLAAFDRDGIDAVRLDAALTDPGRELVPNDGHPNELGHRRIAGLLADQLQPRLEDLLR